MNYLTVTTPLSTLPFLLIPDTTDYSPSTQMGNKGQISTEIALELLLKQIRNIKGLNEVASVLSLDIARAFDTVNYTRLLDNFSQSPHQRAIKMAHLDHWLFSSPTQYYTSGRQRGNRTKGALCWCPARLAVVPEPIFILCDGPLFERLEFTNLPILPLSLADNFCLLAFGNNPASNCRALEKPHGICLQWVEKHEMEFALHKYTLTHFTRRRLQDINAILNLEHVTVSPSHRRKSLGCFWTQSPTLVHTIEKNQDIEKLTDTLPVSQHHKTPVKPDSPAFGLYKSPPPVADDARLRKWPKRGDYCQQRSPSAILG